MPTDAEERRLRQCEYARRSYRKHREKNIQRALRWNKLNPEKHRESHTLWQERNPERARESALAAKRRRRDKHPEALREASRLNMERRRARDPNGEKEKHRQWRAANRAALNMRMAHRRAKKKNAMPQWLTKAHLAEIKAIYVKAKRLGHEVDHVFPLNGRFVSGLHVPWNLQVLPRSENRKKYNRPHDSQGTADARSAVCAPTGGAA